MKKIIFAFAAALAASTGLSACGAPPASVCTSAHVEEADPDAAVAAYAFTGSKLAAAAAAQDNVVCDEWAPIESTP